MMKMNIEQLKANIRQVETEQKAMNYRPRHLTAQDVMGLISEFLCRLAEHKDQVWDDERERWIG